jgi:hypothetical protein
MSSQSAKQACQSASSLTQFVGCTVENRDCCYESYYDLVRTSRMNHKISSTNGSLSSLYSEEGKSSQFDHGTYESPNGAIHVTDPSSRFW